MDIDEERWTDDDTAELCGTAVHALAVGIAKERRAAAAAAEILILLISASNILNEKVHQNNYDLFRSSSASIIMMCSSDLSALRFRFSEVRRVNTYFCTFAILWD